MAKGVLKKENSILLNIFKGLESEWITKISV